MGWLGRLFGKGGGARSAPQADAAPPPPAQGRNVVIVTDLHLGEMLKDRSRIAYLKAATVQDRDFCDLLEHCQGHSPGGRPWRLVLGGDVVDFLQVNVTPRTDVALAKYGFEVGAREAAVGLDNGALKVRWKLLRVMDRHRELFTYLADFVGRGNEVVVIRGNHDAEFFWAEVHQAFRERLADIYFGDEAAEGVTPEEFQGRIRFHPWFYYEPGVVWFEHGHQHDPYCALDHLLCPVLPWDQDRMEWPAVSLAIRYAVNRIPGFTTHDKDDWTFLDYMRWVASDKTTRLGTLVRIYAELVREYFAYYLNYRRSDLRPIRERHDQALRTLAAEGGLSDEALTRMDRGHARPAHLTLPGVANTSLMDRWALVGVGVVALAAVALAGAGPWLLAGAAVAIGGVTVPLMRRMARRLDTYVPPKQRAAARWIQPIVRTRYVIMGHSHAPEVTPLTSVRGPDPAAPIYINTGSWLHYAHAEAQPHADTPDDSACDCGLTHVVILPGEDGAPARAELRRWCVRSRRPVRWIRKDADPS